MKSKKRHGFNEITVIAQTSIELFPVVTCDQRSCHKGYPKMQPTLVMDGRERCFMHHMGPECVDCADFNDVWSLNLRAI